MAAGAGWPKMDWPAGWAGWPKVDEPPNAEVPPKPVLTALLPKAPPVEVAAGAPKGDPKVGLGAAPKTLPEAAGCAPNIPPVPVLPKALVDPGCAPKILDGATVVALPPKLVAHFFPAE